MNKRQEAQRLRDCGWKIPSIASAMGISRQGVHYLLNSPEPLRKPAEPQSRSCVRCGKPVAGQGRVAYCHDPCESASQVRRIIQKIRRLMTKHGITLADLGSLEPTQTTRGDR